VQKLFRYFGDDQAYFTINRHKNSFEYRFLRGEALTKINLVLDEPAHKGVMPDDHPLSVAAARTLALQNADVVFLMGARFNWVFHFGQPLRYAPDVKVIQRDIAPEEIGHNKATDVALVEDLDPVG
jgi:thiamine pyrophosphate-dependent acetolactate synthase large subunit-like protein